MARRDDPGPYSLEALSQIPTPAFFTVDGESWKARLVAWFEGETGRTLYPMQVEMLMIEALAYALAILGEEAQMTAEQHLVVTASLDGLIALGPNRSTPRLDAAKARTIIRFSLAQAVPVNTLIAAGARVSAGSVVFLTLGPAVIAAGALTAEVAAEAVLEGVAANGFLAGQIADMLDPVPGVTAANTVVSEGGADAEDRELYRLRLANAFDRISTGGSHGWYRETTMSVSSAIIDAAVIRPEPCYIDIFPLTAAGAAGPALIAQVAAAFNTAEMLDIRFGDAVAVKPAVAVLRSPAMMVRVRGAAADIAAQAGAAADAKLGEWRQRLGATVAPSEVEAAVRKLSGVVDAEITLASLPFEVLAADEFLVAAPIVLSVEVLDG